MRKLATALTLTTLLFSCSIAQKPKESPEQTQRTRGTPVADAVSDHLEPPTAVGHPTFMSPHASPIAVNGNHVFVVNTPADTVDVINTDTHTISKRIKVGIDPVGIGGDTAEAPKFIELEPLLPAHPAPGEALATPFAIQISSNDTTLVVSAAGSDKLFTVDTTSGAILGHVEVDAVPRGIALESDAKGNPSRAWVLNAVANTVSLVNLSNLTQPAVVGTIPLQDPTHPAVKRGRIAFNAAHASTTGTFSCASCHPDGHTDQLLWVLATPVVTGATQIMPRSTMPVRGLRDTEPFHWNGIPGDPYGGNNSANVHGKVPPNSKLGDPESATRHLVDSSLATTMRLVGDPTVNDDGKGGTLTAVERDDLAKFLLSVLYPPAQRRAYTDVLSSEAKKGFKLFHIDGTSKANPNPMSVATVIVCRFG